MTVVTGRLTDARDTLATDIACFLRAHVSPSLYQYEQVMTLKNRMGQRLLFYEIRLKIYGEKVYRVVKKLHCVCFSRTWFVYI